MNKIERELQKLNTRGLHLQALAQHLNQGGVKRIDLLKWTFKWHQDCIKFAKKKLDDKNFADELLAPNGKLINFANIIYQDSDKDKKLIKEITEFIAAVCNKLMHYIKNSNLSYSADGKGYPPREKGFDLDTHIRVSNTKNSRDRVIQFRRLDNGNFDVEQPIEPMHHWIVEHFYRLKSKGKNNFVFHPKDIATFYKGGVAVKSIRNTLTSLKKLCVDHDVKQIFCSHQEHGKDGWYRFNADLDCVHSPKQSPKFGEHID